MMCSSSSSMTCVTTPPGAALLVQLRFSPAILPDSSAGDLGNSKTLAERGRGGGGNVSGIRLSGSVPGAELGHGPGEYRFGKDMALQDPFLGNPIPQTPLKAVRGPEMHRFWEKGAQKRPGFRETSTPPAHMPRQRHRHPPVGRSAAGCRRAPDVPQGPDMPQGPDVPQGPDMPQGPANVAGP